MNMKLTSIFIGILFIAISCAPKPHDAKADVEAYLNERYGMLDTVIVKECSEIDSLHSSFEILNSAILEYASKVSDAREELCKAYESTSKDEARKHIDKALDYANDDEVKKIVSKEMFFLDNPDAVTAVKNRIGVKASFETMGRSNESFFFYNKDEMTIGHSKLELMSTFKEIVKYQIEIINIRGDINSYKISHRL